MIDKLEKEGGTAEPSPDSDESPGLLMGPMRQSKSTATVEALPGDVELVNTYTTDENGVIALPDLALGTYYAVEQQAPAGYLKSNLIYEVKIELGTDGNVVPVVLSVANEPDPKTVKTDVTVTNYWIHDEGVTAPNATMILKANGVEVDRVTLVPGQHQYTFKNLRVYDDDVNEIAYSITEVDVPGYTGIVYKISAYDFVVINTTADAETTKTIPVFKIWFGDAGTSVTVKLFANGVDTGKRLVLNASNGWFGTFNGLPGCDSKGRNIIYTVDELTVEGYTVRIVGDETIGFIVINTKIVAQNPVDPNPVDPKPPSGPVKPHIPSTGECNLSIVPVLLFSAGAAFMYAGKRKRRSRYRS